MKSKLRGKLDIIAEILGVTQDGALKTQVMYRANLSFSQIGNYIRFMLKIGILKVVSKEGNEIYKTTDKGLEFLRSYQQVRQLMSTEPYERQHEIKSKRKPTHNSGIEVNCPYCGKKLNVKLLVEKAK